MRTESTKNCLTYKELATELKLAPATVRKHWRTYPHFFVTPTSRLKGRLEGARFDLAEVLNHLKDNSTGGHSCGNQERLQQEWHVSRLHQIPRTAVQQSLRNKSRSQSLGSDEKARIGKRDRNLSPFAVCRRGKSLSRILHEQALKSLF